MNGFKCATNGDTETMLCTNTFVQNSQVTTSFKTKLTQFDDEDSSSVIIKPRHSFQIDEDDVISKNKMSCVRPDPEHLEIYYCDDVSISNNCIELTPLPSDLGNDHYSTPSKVKAISTATVIYHDPVLGTPGSPAIMSMGTHIPPSPKTFTPDNNNSTDTICLRISDGEDFVTNSATSKYDQRMHSALSPLKLKDDNLWGLDLDLNPNDPDLGLSSANCAHTDTDKSFLLSCDDDDDSDSMHRSLLDQNHSDGRAEEVINKNKFQCSDFQDLHNNT